MNKRTVVVISRYWPTALSVVRSLGAAGYTVDLIGSAPAQGEFSAAMASKFLRTSVETVWKSVKQSDDPGLMEELLKYNEEDKPVLFPTDDYTASFIDRSRDALSEKFLMPSAGEGGEGAVSRLMNKHLQNSMARESGIMCPEEWLISLRGGIAVPEDMKYPCFCKPMQSTGGFKGEMAKCGDYDALISHLDFLKSRNPDREILVQEFIDIDGEIDLQGVCAGSEVIIPAIIRKTCIAEHEKGVTVAGRMEPYSSIGTAELQEAVKEMLRRCNYTGMFDMEFNISGDRIYFGELNLRSGGPNYAYFLNGVNLPDIAVRAICGEDIRDCDTEIREYGKTFAYEKVLWKEFFDGYISKGELKDILGSDYLLIDSSDDRAPAELFLKGIRAQQNAAYRKRIRRAAGRVIRPVRRTAEGIAKGYPQYRPERLGGLFSSAAGMTETPASPAAIVFGRNYSSNLCMARSLGLSGCDVGILRMTSGKKDELTPEAYSRYVSAFYTIPQKSGSRRIAKYLESIAEKSAKKIASGKVLLVPADDVAAYIIDEHFDELSRYCILPEAGGRQGGIISLMSKARQKELALDTGMPVLDSRYVRVTEGGYSLPEGVKYPCFIKPDVSRRTSKSRMRKCEDESELRAALDEMTRTAGNGIDLLIEEYVEIKRELALLGLSMDGQVMCGGLFETVIGGHGSRRGVALKGRMIPLSELGNTEKSCSLETTVISFMQETGYNGLFDIDLIETMDGRIVFIELNLRYGASGYVLTRAGINLPGLLAEHVFRGRPLAEAAGGSDAGLTFASEKVLLEEYEDGSVTADEISDIMNGADVLFIRDKDDPKPYRVLQKTYGPVLK